MRALYDEGYRSGFQGYRWMKAPPGIAGRPDLPAPGYREFDEPSAVIAELRGARFDMTIRCREGDAKAESCLWARRAIVICLALTHVSG